MMIYERPVHDVIVPSPGSPPGMTASKSSKSSSFHSLSSDDSSVLADASHFEEIGLEDDTLHFEHGTADVKSPTPNRFSPSYPSDLRAASAKHVSQRLPSSRDLASKPRPQPQPQPQRDITAGPRKRPAYPGLQSHVRNINVRSTSTHALVPDPLPMRSLGPRSSSSLSFRRRRSPSPNLSLSPRDPNLVTKPRRSSWQSNRERKSAFQLEQECDEDEGDDIPDGLILDNVPISPRPASERTFSQPNSKAASPERTPKEKVRSVGNGTPAVATAQGSLRSPSWKSDSAASSAKSPTSTDGIPQLKSRAKSWTAALSELNAEAKALTEKLEEHADEIDHKSQRSSTGSMPAVRRSNTDSYGSKPRHKSALAELPPLRRTNIMIDPLPISKEKEAVLSRTRPSWLPPKDPAEERRHLKEYQKMMAHSAEADRRREAAKRAKSDCRDTAADSLMQIWEHDIVPRWNEAIRERRTRELWWQGIAPRSRGLVWTRAIGNDLGLTEASYIAALGRAQEAKIRVSAGNGSEGDMTHNSWFETIGMDAEENTWKDLKIFQKGGPLHQGLIDVLSAYAMYRSDIGYVSGCNTIAALLLLNLPSPAAAFISLANLLNRPLPLSFYASDAAAKASAYNLLLQTLSHKSAELHDHLIKLPEHDADLYLGDIFTSLLTGHLALDEATRLWDVYVFEGDAVLVRAGVAFLLRKEMQLLGTKSIEEVRAVLIDSSSKQDDSNQRVVTRQGEEDRWMRAVREAGKA